jgi:hypothetical protein
MEREELQMNANEFIARFECSRATSPEFSLGTAARDSTGGIGKWYSQSFTPAHGFRRARWINSRSCAVLRVHLVPTVPPTNQRAATKNEARTLKFSPRSLIA